MSELPCGADTDDLVERVAADAAATGAAPETDREAAHRAACPHCRAALDEYRRLWSPVADLADEVVTAPDAVIDRALAAVRAVADNPTVGRVDAAPGDRPGSTWLGARVVVVCARLAAEEVEGVRAALGRVGRSRETSSPRVEVGLAGGTAVVELTVAATWPRDLRALAAEVRARVIQEVRAVTGLSSVTVDVRVDTLLGPT